MAATRSPTFMTLAEEWEYEKEKYIKRGGKSRGKDIILFFKEWRLKKRAPNRPRLETIEVFLARQHEIDAIQKSEWLEEDYDIEYDERVERIQEVQPWRYNRYRYNGRDSHFWRETFIP